MNRDEVIEALKDGKRARFSTGSMYEVFLCDGNLVISRVQGGIGRSYLVIDEWRDGPFEEITTTPPRTKREGLTRAEAILAIKAGGVVHHPVEDEYYEKVLGMPGRYRLISDGHDLIFISPNLRQSCSHHVNYTVWYPKGV